MPNSEKVNIVSLEETRLRKIGPTMMPDKICLIIKDCLKILKINGTAKTINILRLN